MPDLISNDEFTKQVLDRDENKCILCGTNLDLKVARLDPEPDKMFWLKNSFVLCSKHFQTWLFEPDTIAKWVTRRLEELKDKRNKLHKEILEKDEYSDETPKNTTNKKFTILCDTREQCPWKFEKSEYCDGFEKQKLDTGDYTLKGLEKILCIERKGRIAEFAQNVIQPRFHEELERMQDFLYSFLVLEFNMRDVIQYPIGSSIPYGIQRKIKITGKFILSKMTEYELKYRTKIILAGPYGQDKTINIFKSVFKQVQQNETK